MEGVWGRREIAVDAGPQLEDEIGARIAGRANLQFGSDIAVINRRLPAR